MKGSPRTLLPSPSHSLGDPQEPRPAPGSERGSRPHQAVSSVGTGLCPAQHGVPDNSGRLSVPSRLHARRVVPAVVTDHPCVVTEGSYHCVPEARM